MYHFMHALAVEAAAQVYSARLSFMSRKSSKLIADLNLG
jgi:hypothetical protein